MWEYVWGGPDHRELFIAEETGYQPLNNGKPVVDVDRKSSMVLF